MQGNNLNIDIVVNSDAEAKLALLKAQLRATNKEVKQLGDAGAKAGNQMPSKELQDATGRAAALNREIRSLNRTLAQTGDVAAKTGSQVNVSARSFRSLEAAIFNVGKQFGVLGIAGFAAFRGLQAVAQQIDDARKKLLELRDAAQETAQRPAAVKAAQDIATSLGREASDADKFMTGVAESLAKVRTEAGKAIPDLVSGVKVMRGGVDDAASEISGTVKILRGSSRIVFDLANAYKMLGIDARNYKGTAEGILQLQRDVAAAFLRASQSKLFDPVQLNEIAKAIGKGSSAEALLKILPALLQQMDQAIAKNKELNADIANEEARKAAVDRLTKMVDAQIAEHNRLWTSVQTASANALADFIGSIPSWVSAWEQWKKGNQTAIEGFFDWVAAKLAWLNNALSRIVPSIPAAPAGPDYVPPASGMASGGFVSGPGSATSDSILARLSNGEFVMRARAVEHWGPRFMAALNSLQNPFGYHAGGLVTPRFAEGGLVAAGGGTPVHLHLGGAEFALSGHSKVVDALVTEAHRQRMRSGGLKPSWYGGRVSG